MRPHLARQRAPRRDRARRFLLAIAALGVGALTAATPSPAAESERERDLDHWVPSFSFFFDAVRQRASGSVTTGPVLGAPLSPFDQAQDNVLVGNGCLLVDNRFTPPAVSRTGKLCTTVRPNPTQVDQNDSSSDLSVAPLVGLNLELMTPRLLHGFLDPRVFVHADGALAFSFERNLAGKGSPGQFSVPVTSAAQTDIEEFSVNGQGSRTRWQLDRFVYSAGSGVAFTFKVFERSVRIKPSFEWIHVDQDFIGVTHRAVKLESPSGTADLSKFRLISLTRTKTIGFDGVGPGLEIEVDTARIGPFQTSLYMTGRGYHLFGNLDTTLSATNDFGETATWTIEPDPWIVRAGVGFRFRWLPERD